MWATCHNQRRGAAPSGCFLRSPGPTEPLLLVLVPVYFSPCLSSPAIQCHPSYHDHNQKHSQVTGTSTVHGRAGTASPLICVVFSPDLAGDIGLVPEGFLQACFSLGLMLCSLASWPQQKDKRSVIVQERITFAGTYHSLLFITVFLWPYHSFLHTTTSLHTTFLLLLFLGDTLAGSFPPLFFYFLLLGELELAQAVQPKLHIIFRSPQISYDQGRWF